MAVACMLRTQPALHLCSPPQHYLGRPLTPHHLLTCPVARSAGSIQLEPEGPVTAQGGFTVRMSTEWADGSGGLQLPTGAGFDVSARVRFVPPGLVW